MTSPATRVTRFCLLLVLAAPLPLGALEPGQGARLVIMGNGFAEGMYRHGWLEAALQVAYPRRQLRVRNMGWSGDTPALQPRDLNFGDMDEHLGWQRADIIIAAWGMNESFDGVRGLPGFARDLRQWIEQMQASRFNGVSAPQLVLLSPIAHEDLGPPLPDGRAHNRDLLRYTNVMREVAADKGVAFVDLYAASRFYYASDATRPLTRNGIHPTEYGYWFLCREIARQLGLEGTAPAQADAEALARLRQAIWDKNWHFFLRWRPMNMEYIRGRRRQPFGVENFPREFDQLDDMIAQRDERIWRAAQALSGSVWAWSPGTMELWQQLPGQPRTGTGQ